MLLFPLGFLRYVLLKVAAFSCLSYCLAYAFVVVFSNTQRLFVPNNVFGGSRAEDVLRQFFCLLTLPSVFLTKGLISLNFNYALVLFTICFLLQSGSCFTAKFCFLTPSSVNQGLNFAKIFTPWSCLHCVLWLQSRACFMAIFVTWLCRAFYLVMGSNLC